MKTNLVCRIGFHKEKFVRELRVKERGYIKVYNVTKCERCGKLHMSLADVLVDTIAPEFKEEYKFEMA